MQILFSSIHFRISINDLENIEKVLTRLQYYVISNLSLIYIIDNIT